MRIQQYCKMNKVYQIAYDDPTLQARDTGFMLLDNLANERPDWYEYWPIRNFLQTAAMGEADYYGFFSPKFHYKTGLDSLAVHRFIEHEQADVVSFSPYFDQSAYALNVFEQAEANHPGISACFELLFEHIGLPGITRDMVMSSDESIFCNYFLAKRHVWLAWANLCDIIFELSEHGASPLAEALNAPVAYSTAGVSAKVFVIERMISLLIYLNPTWRVKAYDPFLLPFANSPVAKFRDELAVLNALKLAYRHNRRSSDIELFFKIRAGIERAATAE